MGISTLKCFVSYLLIHISVMIDFLYDMYVFTCEKVFKRDFRECFLSIFILIVKSANPFVLRSYRWIVVEGRMSSMFVLTACCIKQI